MPMSIQSQITRIQTDIDSINTELISRGLYSTKKKLDDIVTEIKNMSSLLEVYPEPELGKEVVVGKYGSNTVYRKGYLLDKTNYDSTSSVTRFATTNKTEYQYLLDSNNPPSTTDKILRIFGLFYNANNKTVFAVPSVMSLQNDVHVLFIGGTGVKWVKAEISDGLFNSLGWCKVWVDYYK